MLVLGECIGGGCLGIRLSVYIRCENEGGEKNIGRKDSVLSTKLPTLVRAAWFHYRSFI